MNRTAWMALALLAAAGCQPRPVAESAPAVAEGPERVVEPSQLMADVEALASDGMEGRGAGTAGGLRAADFVERRFREVGLEGAFSGGFRQRVPLRDGGEGVNVVGRVTGTAHPGHVLLITAHFDHLGVRDGQVYNGADDNASGVAAMLAVAERLRERPPAHTVVFAGLDAEEQGLVGARVLAEAPPVPLADVLVVVNLDMVSRGPLWAAGTAHYPHLGAVLAGPPATAAGGTPRAEVQFGHDQGTGPDNWTGASDHVAFHRRGVPFVYLGVEDHADYHRPTDDPEQIDPAVFATAAAAIVRAVEALDGSHAALAAGR